MPTPHAQTERRVDRVRTLLHRLSRTRDIEIEAELISQISLETEAIGRERAHTAGVTVCFAARAADAAPTRARASRRRN